ncbi:protein fem-1 homolog C-like [Octopus sinensis]|uniref:Protein fem-1 homolog C-like n=1 Tax=Octopus sinensis TaxID=2607531 RepID=A0A6P7SQC5_9MOLL|nr:protein fem-1 homolog C-like [Octopus sinensis]
MDHSLDTRRRIKLAKIIMYLMKENDTQRMKKFLSRYTKKQRQDIVSTKLNGSTILFNASNSGNFEQVCYLIQDCNADVEQRGKYGRIKCTPLWIAIRRSHFSIVIMLVDYGADVNTHANGGRSALSIGCKNVKIANFLLRRGADVNSIDELDRSCLMYSSYHLNMCCLLLSYGANISQTDMSSRSSLHFAVKRGHLKIVELFVVNGADLHLEDVQGNTPLQLASLKCRMAITEYLIQTNDYSPEHVACAYELLGSQLLIVRHNYQRAIDFWSKALQLRQSYPNGILKKNMHPDHANTMGILGTEFETLSDLVKISQSLNDMWTQSLLVQFRILGPMHSTTINSFILKAYDFINRQDISLGVNLLTCIFYFFRYYNNPFKEVIFNVIETFSSLFKIRNKKTHDVHVSHLLAFFRCIIHHITTRVAAFLQKIKIKCNKYNSTDVERYLVETLRFTDYIMDFDLTANQLLNLKKLLYNLINQQLRGMGQTNMLHLSIRMTSSTRLLAILIECGENVDATDDRGNTAIHYVMEHHDFFQNSLLRCLINYGCHVDMVNNEGHCTLEYLQHLLPYPLQHMKLQCFAARVIRRNTIPYQHYVPSHLEEFIACHG